MDEVQIKPDNKKSFGNFKKREKRLLPIKYRHIRQACPETFFRNIKYKGFRGYYFCFVTLENEKNLAVEVISPVLRRENKMVADRKVLINVLFRGERVKNWQSEIKWMGDGKAFISDIYEKVGRALRLAATERIFENGDSELTILTDERGFQHFVNQDGVSRRVRYALLD